MRVVFLGVLMHQISLRPIVAGAATMSLFAASAAAFQPETKEYTYDALGRLVAVEHSGAVNDDQAQSICYDDSGNREHLRSDPNGAIATCVDEGSAGAPSGSGSGGGSGGGSNNPPVANTDSISMPCWDSQILNVVANDTDPEGNYPLAVISEDGPYSFVANSTSISIAAQGSPTSYSFNYVVEDSLGAQATGVVQVTVLNIGCGGSGGGGPPL